MADHLRYCRIAVTAIPVAVMPSRERWHARSGLFCANLGWYGNALTLSFLQMLGCNMVIKQVWSFSLQYETVLTTQIIIYYNYYY